MPRSGSHAYRSAASCRLYCGCRPKNAVRNAGLMVTLTGLLWFGYGTQLLLKPVLLVCQTSLKPSGQLNTSEPPTTLKSRCGPAEPATFRIPVFRAEVSQVWPAPGVAGRRVAKDPR